MHPILVHIGGFPVHTYGVLGATAFLVVALGALWRGRRRGLPAQHLADLMFLTAVAAVVGARVVYLAQTPERFTGWTDLVNLRQGGLVFYGSLLFGLPVATLAMRWRRFPFFATWDLFAPLLPLGHGISRLGCLMAGCCFGLRTSLPWAVTYDHPFAPGPHAVPVHPVQVYEALGLFAISAGVFLLERRKPFHGAGMLAYLVSYAVLRVVTELFRGDVSRGLFVDGAVSFSQVISVALIVTALAIFYGAALRSRENAVRGPIAP